MESDLRTTKTTRACRRFRWVAPRSYPIHAASGVGHGQGFAGNSHRHVPDGWLPAVKFLVEELGADVNARDYKGFNSVHHAAARGDNELIRYLVSKGAGCDHRQPQRSDDGRHGEWPRAARPALIRRRLRCSRAWALRTIITASAAEHQHVRHTLGPAFATKLRPTLAIALGWCIAVAPVAGAAGLALRVGTLIDGLGGPPISPAFILIEGERIVAVGAEVEIPADRDAGIIPHGDNAKQFRDLVAWGMEPMGRDPVGDAARGRSCRLGRIGSARSRSESSPTSLPSRAIRSPTSPSSSACTSS